MIKNIYKSYITTIFGVLFLASDLVYFLTSESPDINIIKWIALIGGILLFMSDSIAKKVLDKITSVIK